MTSALRSLRRRIYTPADSQTKVSVRGFNDKNPESTELLETVGRMFLRGYAYAAECREPAEAEEKLEQLPERFRGFAYEGAGMGFAVRDGLPLGRHDLVETFLKGRGGDHIYMVYVGVGWAMARLPRFRWPVVNVEDPLLRWLVLDGYGFHQAYFKTQKYVHEQYRDPKFPWPAEGPRWYADRVIDQGIGRAMWFIGGTDPKVVADLIDRFPADRHDDLYAGSGLAATYAGGVTEEELLYFRDRAGVHAPMVGQASAFAAAARVESGTMAAHSEVATQIFCGMSAQAAQAVTSVARPPLPYTGDVPAFEVWRQNIAAHYATERSDR